MEIQPLPPLPVSHALLEQYRVRTRPHKQAALVGGHRMRRKGQSLEFYEYRPYLPGDDVRHVDWRASTRFGGQDDLLVKSFHAEEHMSLAVSIDTRETMRLPHFMPKLLTALWLAEAITRIALRSDDYVVLHRLFGSGGNALVPLKGTSGLPRIRPALNRLASATIQDETLNLNGLDRYLPPTSVWLIITDFYFDMEHQARKLANRIAHAQDGWRWVILLDLDAWPFEKNYLGTGSRRIEGPGTETEEQDRLLNITDLTLKDIETRIQTHKQQFHQWVTRGAYDHDHWQWPTSETNPKNFFRHHFGTDRTLQRMFMRGSA